MKSIAVIQGGPSSEAEVSRASAKSVQKALEQAGHRAIRLELDGFLADSLRTGGYDVVFPITHGAVGEDGCLQGLIEVMELPYVGSDVLASAVAMNKVMAKRLFEIEGLPVAPWFVSRKGSDDAEKILAKLGNAIVVKPCSGGSAIGVTRLDAGATLATLREALAETFEVDDAALVEAFIPGREVTCAVLHAGGDPVALPPTEIRASKDAFYTYEARYAPGRSEHFCPAPLGDALVKRVQEIAVAAHRTLGCRDLSRVDFVVGDAPVLLEVNTLPGFTDTSLYPEAAGVAGITMPELCARLVEEALRRGSSRRNAPLPLPR